MLERASTCLETGGRQLLRAPKQCIPTRRMLHSTFWHHGAHELPLPPMWWLSPSPSTNAAALDSVSYGDTSHASRGPQVARSPDAPLLDFLYPEKALALIHRWSAPTSDMNNLRRRWNQAPGSRQYSTSQWLPGQSGDGDDQVLQEAKGEMERLVLDNTPEDALNHLLQTRPPDKQELAWLLHSSLDEPRPTDTKLLALLAYLGEGDMSRFATRIVQLFDAIEPDLRDAPSYRIVITAHVNLGTTGLAIQLQEEALSLFDTLDLGIDAIIKRTIQDNQWELTWRVFRTSRQHLLRLDPELEHASDVRLTMALATIWRQVPQLPDLVEHYNSFFIHMQQYQHEWCASSQQRKDLVLFTAGFLPSVVDHVIDSPEPDENEIHNFFVNLFRDLSAIQVHGSLLYEYTISKMLQTPRYRKYTRRKQKVWLNLYTHYCESCKDLPGRKPSPSLIFKLIQQHGAHDSSKRVDAMIEDHITFYPERPFTRDNLSYFIQFYARMGNADKAHKYFEELQTRFPQSLSLHHISSLVYVHTRRTDPEAAVQQFKRINAEFGLVPDLVCWNNLLHAFCRADDLDGSLECFNNILDSGIEPDLLTFGPLLDLCASRGDVEAFETLFTKAQEMKIPVERDRRARSGYVQAFLSAGDAEAAEEIVRVMCRDWFAGTMRGDSLTHPWNILLFHYAAQGDVFNTRRLYREMREHNIPIDTWTYAALMRSLTESKTTNAAWKILNETMREKNVRPHAYHYAIVLSGFLREQQLGHARRVLRQMKMLRLAPTRSSRGTAILTTGLLELEKLRTERNKDPHARLVEVEQELRASIMTDYGQEIANNQPVFKRYIDAPELDNVPPGYFELVIMLYNTRGAFDICKQLFEAATKATSIATNRIAPIALLSAIMETHLKAKEYDDVEKCWALARTGADRLVKTFQQVVEPEQPAPVSDSITNPAVREAMESARIARRRRHILVKPARHYIRSLLAQKDNPNALQQAQRTLHDLLINGFVIDTLTWNKLIQHLALRGRLIDAFTAFEMYLMPSFPGWTELTPGYIRKWPRSYKFMEIRRSQVPKTTVMPRYETMVILAAAYAQTQREERYGRGYHQEMEAWMPEILERIAPMTISAIDSMPRTGDGIQAQYLYNY
ncbi:hypothetical protein DM02DRAFT_594583 [Periconia macrospinosa]|uniref:TPR-like protein n=1 Tax=Periconia macrospinosa TaxID=97972 RepID=A0A2V1DM60_9PLEO|nr:hypothetical protein DM02DRAFT_594583 [Periconia macrospinosa]